MIGAAQYALMKPNAYFITTARGNIHDEDGARGGAAREEDRGRRPRRVGEGAAAARSSAAAVRQRDGEPAHRRRHARGARQHGPHRGRADARGARRQAGRARAQSGGLAALCGAVPGDVRVCAGGCPAAAADDPQHRNQSLLDHREPVAGHPRRLVRRAVDRGRRAEADRGGDRAARARFRPSRPRSPGSAPASAASRWAGSRTATACAGPSLFGARDDRDRACDLGVRAGRGSGQPGRSISATACSWACSAMPA